MTTILRHLANQKHLAQTNAKALWPLRYRYKPLFRIPIQQKKFIGIKLSWRRAKFNRQTVYFTATSQRVHAIFTLVWGLKYCFSEIWRLAAYLAANGLEQQTADAEVDESAAFSQLQRRPVIFANGIKGRTSAFHYMLA